MHVMTSSMTYTLRVDLTGFDDVSNYAEYTTFVVDSESDNYMLHISGFSGNTSMFMSQ